MARKVAPNGDQRPYRLGGERRTLVPNELACGGVIMSTQVVVEVPTTVAVAARAVDAVKVYGSGATEVRALDGINVEFAAGRWTAIMGPSGSGKSTLLHCMAGLDSLTSGAVFIGDTDLTTLDDKRLTLLRREQIGFVFQSFNLVPTLTAQENITLPLALGGRRVDPEWLHVLVSALHLEDRLQHRPSELSGGQQQRVAAARSMVTRPVLIFADEPTGNLDSKSATEMLEMTRAAVGGFGQTVVMVTHDARAASYADRVLFVADGRIVQQLEDPTMNGILDELKRLGA
jgi:putative ABC transport system ATP-binding protein